MEEEKKSFFTSLKNFFKRFLPGKKAAVTLGIAAAATGAFSDKTAEASEKKVVADGSPKIEQQVDAKAINPVNLESLSVNANEIQSATTVEQQKQGLEKFAKDAQNAVDILKGGQNVVNSAQNLGNSSDLNSAINDLENTIKKGNDLSQILSKPGNEDIKVVNANSEKQNSKETAQTTKSGKVSQYKIQGSDDAANAIFNDIASPTNESAKYELDTSKVKSSGLETLGYELGDKGNKAVEQDIKNVRENISYQINHTSDSKSVKGNPIDIEDILSSNIVDLEVKVSEAKANGNLEAAEKYQKEVDVLRDRRIELTNQRLHTDNAAPEVSPEEQKAINQANEARKVSSKTVEKMSDFTGLSAEDLSSRKVDLQVLIRNAEQNGDTETANKLRDISANAQSRIEFLESTTKGENEITPENVISPKDSSGSAAEIVLAADAIEKDTANDVVVEKANAKKVKVEKTKTNNLKVEKENVQSDSNAKVSPYKIAGSKDVAEAIFSEIQGGQPADTQDYAEINKKLATENKITNMDALNNIGNYSQMGEFDEDDGIVKTAESDTKPEVTVEQVDDKTVLHASGVAKPGEKSDDVDQQILNLKAEQVQAARRNDTAKVKELQEKASELADQKVKAESVKKETKKDVKAKAVSKDEKADDVWDVDPVITDWLNSFKTENDKKSRDGGEER